MFFIQVLQVDFLADFQFTLVYTGLLFLPPDESASVDAAACIGAGASRSNSLLLSPRTEQRSPLRGKENDVPSNTSNSGKFLAEASKKSLVEGTLPDRSDEDNVVAVEEEDVCRAMQPSLGEA